MSSGRRKTRQVLFYSQKFYYLESDSNSLHQVKPNISDMAAEGHYVPQTRVDWTSTKVSTIQTLAKRGGEEYKWASRIKTRQSEV